MSENKTFEEIMQELKKLVQNLEQEEISLEDSVKNFERGMELVKKAEEILTQAQSKIEVMENNS